ncbi:hypothetical protein [Glutamicibacter arilaitensis]|uniref:hypothetical protein n=1 Tax=Glutamicibacter arilaitensis TaxID=256701 RepID=UPI003F8EC645
MARITWYYGRTGRGQVGEIAAHSIPSVRGLKRAADAIGDKAASNLDVRALRRTGDSHITVTQGDLDYYVNLVDPEGGAIGIELGWSQVHKDSGHVYGSDGLAVLRDAATSVRRKGVIL